MFFSTTKKRLIQLATCISSLVGCYEVRSVLTNNCIIPPTYFLCAYICGKKRANCFLLILTNTMLMFFMIQILALKKRLIQFATCTSPLIGCYEVRSVLTNNCIIPPTYFLCAFICGKKRANCFWANFY